MNSTRTTNGSTGFFGREDGGRLHPRMKVWRRLAAIMALGGGLTAWGDSIEVFYSQDFDGMVLGNINGQTDSGPLAPAATWGGNTGSGTEDVVQNSVANTGLALYVGNQGSSGATRANIFDAVANQPTATLKFDFRFKQVVADIATPDTYIPMIMDFRGPNANMNFQLFYNGYRNSSGIVVANRLELRGGPTTNNSPEGLNSTSWYQATFDIDWVAGTIDLLVFDLTANAVFWDPAVKAAAFWNNGNINSMGFFGTPGGDGVGFYVDNIEVASTVIPEPASMLIFSVGGLLALRRRRR